MSAETEDEFREIQAAMYADNPFIRRRFTDVDEWAEFLATSAHLRNPHRSLEEIQRTVREMVNEMRHDVGHYALNDLECEAQIHPRLIEIRSFIRDVETEQLATSEPLDFGRLHLGTLPTYTPNAMAIQFPNGDAHVVIAVSEGLPQLLNRFTKLCLSTERAVVDSLVQIPSEQLEMSNDEYVKLYEWTVRRTIQENAWLGKYFIDILLAFRGGADISQLRRSVMPNGSNDDRTWNEFVRPTVLTGGENFILAHEFGHFLLGHIGQTVPIELAGKEAQIYRWSQDRELEADEFGFSVASAIAHRRFYSPENQEWDLLYDRELSGIFLFFEAVHCLNSCDEISSGLPAVPTSHPLPRLRIAACKRRYREITGVDSSFEMVASMHTLRAFWTECEPNIRLILTEL